MVYLIYVNYLFVLEPFTILLHQYKKLHFRVFHQLFMIFAKRSFQNRGFPKIFPIFLPVTDD